MQRLSSSGMSSTPAILFGKSSKKNNSPNAYPVSSYLKPQTQPVFNVDYIDSPVGQQNYMPHNQALIDDIMDLTKKGKGIRSYFLGENYTERKALHVIKTMALLMQQNVSPLYPQLGQLNTALNQRLASQHQMTLPQHPDITHSLMAKIDEHANKGTGWRSYVADENYAERQILRTSNYLMQACIHHFNGLYNALDVVQQQADKLHPTGQPAILARPHNDGFLSEAAEYKKDGTGFLGSFVLSENHTEIEGVRHLEVFAKTLVNNMECLHQRLDALRKQLGEHTMEPELAKPNNQAYFQQVKRLASEGTGFRAHGAYGVHDPNFVERRLIEMLKPITHILVGNLESIQRKLKTVKL